MCLLFSESRGRKNILLILSSRNQIDNQYVKNSKPVPTADDSCPAGKIANAGGEEELVEKSGRAEAGRQEL